ncbi:unnamed protein product [Timema podura]|uniref:Uncharacterized protein n=1 Tax=Timema podura TaxID=61482 RepID=A0ABN7PFF1_TIMPD|nr:unnamed protein product [Timema podura]
MSESIILPRGVISTPDSKYFIINPLPQRFHNSSENIPHVVMQWTPQGHGHFGQQRSFARRKKRSRGTFGSNQIRVPPIKPLSRKDIGKNFSPRLVSGSGNRTRESYNRLCSHERTSEDSVFKDDDRFEKHNDGPLPLVSHAGDCEVNVCVGDERADVTPRRRGSSTDDQESQDARTSRRRRRSLLPPIYVETAVFVDKDLFRHMALNFPTDTERELIRVVLAMINAISGREKGLSENNSYAGQILSTIGRFFSACVETFVTNQAGKWWTWSIVETILYLPLSQVQLLYHDPSLGRQVNFVLKRVEILHADPTFLSSFCTWQHGEDPQGDSDPLHWDHALILTGLDLYVVSKNGKVSSQVVGNLNLEEVHPHFHGGRVENHLGKIPLNAPNLVQTSIPFGSPVYCESNTLDHAATGASVNNVNK